MSKDDMKTDLITEEPVWSRSQRSASSWSAVSICILSLLLTATVGCLIYNDLAGASRCAETKSTTDKPAVVDHSTDEISTTVHVIEQGYDYDETVGYDEKRDVAYFRGSDGSFTLEDFRKGISIAKDTMTGDCFVIPIGTNETQGRQIKSFIQHYHGEEVDLKVSGTYKSMVLPGLITDSSFIPEEAERECNNYRWLSIVAEQLPSEQGGSNRREMVRTKRDISCPFVCIQSLLRDGTLETNCYIFFDLCESSDDN